MESTVTVHRADGKVMREALWRIAGKTGEAPPVPYAGKRIFSAK
ncbi:hypothetical protein [Selenomonas felix]|nr:hypothetical protein [Selenomonas felix]